MKIDLPAREKVYRKNSGILVSLHLDGWLMLGIFLLIITGSLIVFSASGADQEVLSRHLIRVGFAFILMLVFAQIPPNLLRIYTPWVFGIGTIMLISVLLFGDIGKGAKRWLDLGFFRFQPSEIMKLALPMMIAWLFAHDSLPPPNKKMLIGLGLVGLIAGLIIIQPDLGTSILIAMSGLFVLFFAGLSWRWILSAVGLVAASLPIVWNFYMYDYQKQRVLTFLDPESDPLGTGYHIIQSKIAIGSGGLEGKGFMGSTQAHLEFLPESTTDFIFSVLAEEFGLIGVTGLLLLYLFVIGRGLYIASQAQENFARLTAASLVMTLFVYVFVNIGMVSGLLPVVGLPLPLLSYGGSSLVTLMVSFGILMSIHTHKKLLTS
ncbi:rod shape-determining protein RodA [Hydrogenovibrio sp. 3SP14C1]|uniref:rod shape-determining protein RodA n=1 Tax=Hydrogenovibrio sp. 3SP14C1 TaxID=3038774 RepID=UPI002417D60D|nr:rod shape-determining protein RodA [Hydrogenovibrio sp. 3SP14C1]MDG4812201.1 rod shape-determining protein RodA [Hydrogenovibrio sp. 3SP14C1]